MNVFHKFTRLSLKRNFTRTLVTIIGIVLSMSLFTAVMQGAYSGIRYMTRIEEDTSGRYHGFYYDLTDEEVQKVLSDAETDETVSWRHVGHALAENGNERRPYLIIKSADANINDLVRVRITGGRMPENENEIIVPDDLKKNGRPLYKVGDVIDLLVGKRIVNGIKPEDQYPYSPEVGDEITDAAEKTYTVVGTYSGFSHPVMEYDSGGYIAITAGAAEGSTDVFFRVKHPSQYYSYMKENAVSRKLKSHSDLLMFSGSVSNGGIANFIYGFAVILVFLVMFGSISLIYNSFSISVSERTKQFGLLKSVGATKRQISGAVMYEALLLSCIAIPIGLAVGLAGIGITLYCLRDSFDYIVSMSTDVKIQLEVAPLGILASVLVCIVTALISAYIPARRAMSVSAIESINQTRDVKIRQRDVRTFKLTEKLFGFEGMLASKNFGRNKKRYRATVLSLFLSVTLFISSSAFCMYFTDTVTGVSGAYGITGPDIQYRMIGYRTDDMDDHVQKVYTLLSGAEAVEDKAYYQDMYTMVEFDTDVYSNEFESYTDIYTDIMFLDDDSFRKLCRDNGLNENEYMDPASPKALAINTVLSQNVEAGKLKEAEVLIASKLPTVGTASALKQFDGFECAAIDEQGNYYFLENEYYSQLMSEGVGVGNISSYDMDRVKVLSKEEAFAKMQFTVGTVIKEKPLAYNGNYTLQLIYPYAAKDALLNENVADIVNDICLVFSSYDHTATYDSMQRLLNENGMSDSGLTDLAKMYEALRAISDIINVFSYGFIILISLIAVANVFNTISTNIMLRRREFAMLKSVGLTEKGFNRMMNFECIRYGVKALIYGLPVSFAMTYLMYMISGSAYETSYYIPWGSVVIAVGSVFAVVFATMFYASHKIKKDNPIDALKNENI